MTDGTLIPQVQVSSSTFTSLQVSSSKSCQVLSFIHSSTTEDAIQHNTYRMSLNNQTWPDKVRVT